MKPNELRAAVPKEDLNDNHCYYRRASDLRGLHGLRQTSEAIHANEFPVITYSLHNHHLQEVGLARRLLFSAMHCHDGISCLDHTVSFGLGKALCDH